MGCKGLHCDGCNHGGGGPAAVVIALLVIIAVGLRAAWPQIVHVLQIAAWTVAGLTGAAILTTGGMLTACTVRRVRRAAQQVTYHASVIPPARLTEPPGIDRPRRPALGQPRSTGPGRGRWPDGGGTSAPRIGGDGDEHRPR